jgi:hypothetical protein
LTVAEKKEALPIEQHKETPVESVSEVRSVGKCSRCGRRLTDPTSVRRGVGPVCWGACGGDVFEADLEASDEEWERREKVLRSGGEIDFGCNWRHIEYDPNMALQLPVSMRVSLRCKDGQLEAYGLVFDPRGHYEVVFGRSQDIREISRMAVNAGPASEAQVYRIQRAARRKNRRVA